MGKVLVFKAYPINVGFYDELCKSLIIVIVCLILFMAMARKYKSLPPLYNFSIPTDVQRQLPDFSNVRSTVH